uniref:Secreted protein n=1 Tax=Panagrellus redivivus TaxID=6233 RepID=A0A7E4V8K0_PANRE
MQKAIVVALTFLIIGTVFTSAFRVKSANATAVLGENPRHRPIHAVYLRKLRHPTRRNNATAVPALKQRRHIRRGVARVEPASKNLPETSS